jgi:hypothetical protein
MSRSKLFRIVPALVAIGLSLMPCAVARAALVAYWDMNAATGGTVADASGNGHNATLSGSATWATGRFGNGVSLPAGFSNFIKTDSAFPALGTGDFTVSLWFKGASPGGGWRNLFMDGEYANNALYMTTCDMTWHDLPEQSLRVSMGAFFTDVASGPTIFNNTSWYNVALTRSGTTVTAYVNGVQEGTSTTSAANIASHIVSMGGTSDLGNGLIGMMDDVAVWNQSLTLGQIAAIANGTLSPSSFVVPEPSTLALAVTGLVGLLAFVWRKRR